MTIDELNELAEDVQKLIIGLILFFTWPIWLPIKLLIDWRILK